MSNQEEKFHPPAQWAVDVARKLYNRSRSAAEASGARMNEYRESNALIDAKAIEDASPVAKLIESINGLLNDSSANARLTARLLLKELEA